MSCRMGNGYNNATKYNLHSEKVRNAFEMRSKASRYALYVKKGKRQGYIIMGEVRNQEEIEPDSIIDNNARYI